MKIIAGFTQFHQELFLLRLLSQSHSKSTIITFSQKSNNYLINLLTHFKFDQNKIRVITINEITSNDKTYICYLSYFEKINQLEKVNNLLNISYLFISHELLKKLQATKKINKQIISNKIDPTKKELIKINYLTKQIKRIAQKNKIAPELILTPAQIRLVSLIKLKGNELWKIPGLGTGWQLKWDDTICKLLIDLDEL